MHENPAEILVIFFNAMIEILYFRNTGTAGSPSFVEQTGTNNPFDGVDVGIEEDLIDYISALDPDVVAVGLGQGKQEAFMAAASRLLPRVRIWIGVGGTFESLSHQKPRAPVWMRRAGLEWLWRVCIEPSRWRRIVDAVVVFPIIVVLVTLRKRRFFKACRGVFSELFTQFYDR